jgi:hypothetical protein
MAALKAHSQNEESARQCSFRCCYTQCMPKLFFSTAAVAELCASKLLEQQLQTAPRLETVAVHSKLLPTTQIAACCCRRPLHQHTPPLTSHPLRPFPTSRIVTCPNTPRYTPCLHAATTALRQPNSSSTPATPTEPEAPQQALCCCNTVQQTLTHK